MTMIGKDAERIASRVPVAEVERYFGAYVERVAVEGERFVLTRDGRPVAEIRPVDAREARRPMIADLPALLASLPHGSEDDMDPFAGDLEAIAADRPRKSLEELFAPHPKMSPEEAESFARDVEAAHAEMNVVPRIHPRDSRSLW